MHIDITAVSTKCMYQKMWTSNEKEIGQTLMLQSHTIGDARLSSLSAGLLPTTVLAECPPCMCTFPGPNFDLGAFFLIQSSKMVAVIMAVRVVEHTNVTLTVMAATWEHNEEDEEEERESSAVTESARRVE